MNTRKPKATNVGDALPEIDPTKFLRRLNALIVLMWLIGPPWVRETDDPEPDEEEAICASLQPSSAETSP
jgi:hypothetical protein